jgi:hypothetical protein
MPEVCSVKSCQRKFRHPQTHNSPLQDRIQRSSKRQPIALENVSDIFQIQSIDDEEKQNKQSRRYSCRQSLNYIQSEFDSNPNLTNEKNGFYTNRTAYCMRRQFDTSKPTYLYDNGKIMNMFFCQTAKCPTCSGRFFEQWNNDIHKVVSHVQKNHGFVYMLTTTVPHTVKDLPEEIYDLLSAAKTKLMKHKVIKDLYPICNVCRIEDPYGRNGWHYHGHTLIAFDQELLDSHIEAIKDQWVKIGKSFGKHFSRDCIDIRLTRHISEAINYVCKELTSTTTKEDSKKESMTMFEIISHASRNEWDKMPYGRDKVAKLIEQWYGVKNKKTFITDAGFKNILENAQKAEEETVIEEVKETENRIRISPQAVHSFIGINLWSKVLLAHVRNNDLNDTLADIWGMAEKVGMNQFEGFEDLKKHIDIERVDDTESEEVRLKYQPLDCDVWDNLSSNVYHNSKFDDKPKEDDPTEEELFEFFAPLAA